MLTVFDALVSLMLLLALPMAWSQRIHIEQILRRHDPFSGILPLRYQPGNEGKLIVLRLLPYFALSCLTWPPLAIWSIALLTRTSRKHKLNLWKGTVPLDDARIGEDLLAASKNSFFPIAVSELMILCILVVVAVGGAAHLPALIWLFCVWATLLSWIVISHFSKQTFKNLVRHDPKHKVGNLISFAILFGVLFPLVSSVITVALRFDRFTTEDVATSLLRIASLGGVLWEGPKAGLMSLSDHPEDFLQVVTGSAIYIFLLKGLYSTIFSPVSSAELESAALHNLSIGETTYAKTVIDRIPEDTPSVWYLRILCRMMDDHIKEAISLFKGKFPQLSNYGSSADVTAVSFLMILTCSWKVKEAVKLELWKGLVESEPREEDLILLWFIFRPYRNWGELVYSDSRFIEFATLKGFLIFQLLFRSERNEDEHLPELAIKIAESSPTSVAIGFWTSAVLFITASKREPSRTSEFFSAYLQEIHPRIAHIDCLSGLAVASAAIQALSSTSDLRNNPPLANWIDKGIELVDERILLYPNGHEILLRFRNAMPRRTPELPADGTRSTLRASFPGT